MNNYYELATLHGRLEIYYKDNAVLVLKVEGDGWSYLPGLLFSINGSVVEPKLTALVDSHVEIVSKEGLINSYLHLGKDKPIYYRGQVSLLPKLLYNYYADVTKGEPLHNDDFYDSFYDYFKLGSFRLDSLTGA